MSESVRTKDGIETVIDDQSLTPLRVDAAPARELLTNAVNSAFEKAKLASETENMRARKIAADLRIKREGVAEKIDTTNTAPPSPSEQASIFDF